MSDNRFVIAEHTHTREASASLQNKVKLLHIVKRMRNNASSTGENEARVTPYEAIMEIMKRCLHTMKRSLSASCFFAVKAKKMADGSARRGTASG